MGGLGKPLPIEGDRQHCPLCTASSSSLRCSTPCPLPGKGQLAQVGEEWAQQLLGRKGDGGAVPWHTITRAVPFRQISNFALDLLCHGQAELSPHLPWVPHAPTSTQSLVLLRVMCLMESKPFAAGLKPHFPLLCHPGQVSS